MDEAREEAMNITCPRRLDFNLPLLSTRRLGGFPGTNSRIAFRDTNNGIPFCWEQAPGKPKNTETNDTPNGDGDTPRPRLPPCRWQPQKKASASVNSINIHDQDDGCDADVDDNDYDDNNFDDDDDDVFSEAVDILSLTEAIDIVQKAEDDNRLDRLNLESVESRGSQSPNFMMERFLPDATALAASSVLYASSKNLNKKLPYFCSSYAEEYNSQIVGGSYSSETSHKGCGLEIFFPWRMKHKLCGVKSPVRQVSPNVQPIWTAKQKKHCSTNRQFSDLKKYI
ncbi:hypothetical protein JCGZ_00436 [Jatropha curcas]|uniref:Uncharacterized protein n=1 Tax=Jatropha curcas TaxID=180498 RepID=A0A067JTI2_JATCU|nr:uncharacterized protein LOC105648109 [Jatropha curcas]KDP22849.1 hypothetical protein JCGZ_00436 [Jatropha curcas]